MSRKNPQRLEKLLATAKPAPGTTLSDAPLNLTSSDVTSREAPEQSSPNVPKRPLTPALRLSPLGGTRSTLLHLQNREDAVAEKEARIREIEARLTAGLTIIELDPDLVDASMILDRLPGGDTDYPMLLDSIRVRGQTSPILVRPHPEIAERYQVAFGHRRLRAAHELGRPVKAVVRELSDADLILAQGEENAVRTNLSFIEQALFANRIEEAGHNRQFIAEALCVHKSTLSTMIATINTLPLPVIHSIGAAPGIGRPRWQHLCDRYAKRLTEPSFQGALLDFVASSHLPADSNARFEAVLTFVETKSLTRERRAKDTQQHWTTPAGTQIASIRSGPNKFTLSIKQQLVPGFGDYLLTQLDRLYADFSRTQEAPTEDT